MSGKTSYEPRRTSASSDDLKWRMVWQCDTLGLKYSDVAANLGVDLATVCQTVTKFQETRVVQKKKYPSPRAYNKLTTPVELTIVHLVLERPGIILHEIRSHRAA